MPGSNTCIVKSSGGSDDVLWAWSSKRAAVAGLGGTVAVEAGIATTVAVYAKTLRGKCEYYAPVGFAVLVADAQMTAPAVGVPLQAVEPTDRTLSGLFAALPIVDFAPHAIEYERRFIEWITNPKAFVREAHGLDHSSFRYAYRKGRVPAGDGLPLFALVGTREETIKDWEKAVALASILVGAHKRSPAIDECVAAVALTLLAGPYPGFAGGENIHKTSTGWSATYDSRGHPLFDFYSNKDCDGKAMAICSFWKLLKVHLAAEEDREGMTPEAANAAAAIVDNYNDCAMAHVLVDAEIARGSPGSRPRLTPPTLGGHCVAVILREKQSMKNMLVCDGCNCMVPHVAPPWNAATKELLYDAPFEDRCRVGGYCTVDPIAGYEEIRAVYGKGWFMVNRGAPKTAEKKTNFTWDNRTLTYSESTSASSSSLYDADGRLKTLRAGTSEPNPFSFAAAASGAAPFELAPQNTDECRKELARSGADPVVAISELARIARALNIAPAMEWTGGTFAALDRGAAGHVLPEGPNVVQVAELVRFTMYGGAALRDHGSK